MPVTDLVLGGRNFRTTRSNLGELLVGVGELQIWEVLGKEAKHVTEQIRFCALHCGAI